jgi:hypothetical protein
MKERDFTPFNHGYLCEMLRSANDKDLISVFEDVNKELERRKAAKKNEYLNNIRNAISEAVKAGYRVSFYYDFDSEHAAFSVHDVNESFYDIKLYTDD